MYNTNKYNNILHDIAEFEYILPPTAPLYAVYAVDGR